MLLDLPHDDIRSMARFRLCAQTLRIETLAWTHNTSPTGAFVILMMYRTSTHPFHCTHPHVVSLQRTYASLLSFAGLSSACQAAFLGQENSKLNFFLPKE